MLARGTYRGRALRSGRKHRPTHPDPAAPAQALLPARNSSSSAPAAARGGKADLSRGGKIIKKKKKKRRNKNPEGPGGSERAMRNVRAQGMVFAAGAAITPGSGALSLPTRCPAEHVPRRLQARGDVICPPPASPGPASQKSRPKLGAVRRAGSAGHAPAAARPNPPAGPRLSAPPACR